MKFVKSMLLAVKQEFALMFSLKLLQFFSNKPTLRSSKDLQGPVRTCKVPTLVTMQEPLKSLKTCISIKIPSQNNVFQIFSIKTQFHVKHEKLQELYIL